MKEFSSLAYTESNFICNIKKKVFQYGTEISSTSDV
jgi:hypothetical protein